MTATNTEIQYFVAVFQAEHISRAALRLGVSQPTLTQVILKLEEKLNAKLFYRTKQGVLPTAEGKIFYAHAHKLLDLWKNVRGDIHTHRNSLSRRFRIGCHQSVGAYTIPRLLKNLSESAPQIEIDLTHNFSSKIADALISFNIDLGYIVNPVRHPDLVLKKLGTDFVTLWRHKNISPKKRIFTNGDRTQLEDWLGKTHAKEFKDWSIVHSSSFELIRTLTLSGEGIGFLPERVAKTDNHNLVTFGTHLPIRKDEVYLGFRKEVLADVAGKELVRLASFEL